MLRPTLRTLGTWKTSVLITFFVLAASLGPPRSLRADPLPTNTYRGPTSVCCHCWGGVGSTDTLTSLLGRRECDDGARTDGFRVCRKVKVKGDVCSWARMRQTSNGLECSVEPLELADTATRKYLAPPIGWVSKCNVELVTEPPEPKLDNRNTNESGTWCSCYGDPRNVKKCVFEYVQDWKISERLSREFQDDGTCSRATCATLYSDKRDQCPILYDKR
jgi:hypothetical protein